MKKIVKNTIIILPILLILAYLTLLIFIKSSLDTNNIRNKINESLDSKIKEYKNHYLFKNRDIIFSIQSPISISAIPSIKMVIRNIKMKDIQYRNNLFSINIKRIEIKLGFKDFFKKKLTVKNAITTGIEINIQDNELPDFYLKKEIVKKKVKLTDNEVYGIKNKLKDILAGYTDNNVEEGYKIVEVIEDVRVDLDNSMVQVMLLDLIKTLEISNIKFGKKTDIAFSGTNLNFIRNGSIQKEIKNISGNIDGEKTKKIIANFNLNNVNGKANFVLDKKENNITLEADISNDLGDKINLKYLGDNLLLKDLSQLLANLTIEIKTKSFNDFSQWILSTDSKYYYLFDYKKNIHFKADIDKNEKFYNVKSFSISGEDINISGSLDLNDTKNVFVFNINNLNLDNMVINFKKHKTTTDPNIINIFKVKNQEELIELISNDHTSTSINSSAKINVKNIIKNSKTLKDSGFDFEMSNGSYRINSFKVNYDDIEITVDNQQEINGIFINDINISGLDFTNLISFLNIPNFLNIKEFNLKSKILIYNNIIYLLDYTIGNDDNKINGSFEYSFGDKNYIACSAEINNLEIKTKKKKTKTLKEQLLWLNNFTKNVFLDLAINNLNYNNMEHIVFKSKINYLPGYLNLYDIKDISFEKVNMITGSILFDIRKNNPFIKIDLNIGNIEKEINLINYIFDIEKYKNLLLRETIDEKNQANYWVNKLFSIPLFDQINGKVDLKIKRFDLNKLPLNDIQCDLDIKEGILNIKDIRFNGLGGSTILKGSVDLKTTKSLNLTLTDTVYQVSDVVKMFINSDKIGDLDGTIGIGGIIKGVGFNSGVFNSSLSMESKFVGKNLFIKKIGFDDLRKKLLKIYTDIEILKSLDVKKTLMNNTGTKFNNFNGIFQMNSGISNFSADAKGNGISTKVELKVDNTSSSTIVKMINTSLIMTRAGNSNIPLYLTINFTEDFANKANLTINTDQIDEYIKQVRDAYRGK